MMRLWRITALICAGGCAVSLSSLAQMMEQPEVDLRQGLVVHHQVEINLHQDKDGLLGGQDFAQPMDLADCTLSFCLSFPEVPGGGGDHRLRFAAMRIGELDLSLAVTPQGHLLLQGDDNLRIVCDNPLKAGRNAIAICVKRDSKQSLSALWLDGVEQASFPTMPGRGNLTELVIGGMELGQGVISDIRLYNRSLTRPELMALAQQAQDGAVQPPHEVLALIGGTEATALAESGWLDAMLSLRLVETLEHRAPALRDLAWEGDTVFEQKRPLNFGSIAQQLQRVRSRRALIMLGRQECMERGAEGVPAFRDTLTRLVLQCPPEAVLIGAVPFEKMNAPLPDLSSKNEALRLYDEAMREVAIENRGAFIDVRRSWRKQEAGWTRDGLTLNDNGARLLADIIAFYLGNNKSQDPAEPDLERLRSLAVQKEALWHRFWRPANWAFLYGDRTTQPSSRDHMDPNIRWFPQELEQYHALIDAKEQELQKLSQELRRKLP